MQKFCYVTDLGYNTYHGPRRDRKFFLLFYVLIMGLTHCYKMTVFNIYICSFFTEFIL